MATIMTQGNSEGTRRCDGTCHNAKKPKCTCICGGRYHGAGKMAQELLTRDWLGADWREKKATIEAAGGTLEAVVGEALAAGVTRSRRTRAQQASLDFKKPEVS
jgi:hypothetical protein